MRIVSKYHDYYDSVMGHGQDQGTVYLRREEAVTDKDLLKRLITETVSKWDRRYHEYKDIPAVLIPPSFSGDSVPVEHPDILKLDFDAGFVLFCGKIYRYIEVQVHPRATVADPFATMKADFFYDLNDFVTFLQSCGKLVKDIYRRKYFGLDPVSSLRFERSVEAFLSSQGTDELEELLVKHRVVTARRLWDRDLVSRRGYFWATDAPLKDVKFFKVKDPYTAFQELDMYISGVLGQQAKEVINISDKDRIVQHGFDNSSFRKEPQIKGRKRQR